MRNPRLRVLALVLAGLVLASTLLPAADEAPKPRLPPAPAAAGGQELVGALPEEEVVRAEVGDLVRLVVSARRPTGVELAAFGELELAAPGAPARFTVLADRRGEFPVRYTESGELAGLLRVG